MKSIRRAFFSDSLKSRVAKQAVLRFDLLSGAIDILSRGFRGRQNGMDGIQSTVRFGFNTYALRARIIFGFRRERLGSVNAVTPGFGYSTLPGKPRESF